MPAIPHMHAFQPLSVPAPIHCAWCPYRRGESAQALVLPWLTQQLEPAPQTLGLWRDARGRPHLTGVMEALDINWSHSGQALLVAFGRGVQLGADIEYLRPRRNALALAERFFAPAEAMQLRGLPESVRERTFTALWCAKEAVLKAHGHGISYGLDRLTFRLDGAHWHLLHCQGELGRAEDWTVHAFTPLPGYLAALAWRVR